MALKIVVSKVVKFKVRGALKDESGSDQPFDFTLTCKRLLSDELGDRFGEQSTEKLIDFFRDVVHGWDGVKDEEGLALPYSQAALDELFRIPGMALLVAHTYLSEVRVKEKN